MDINNMYKKIENYNLVSYMNKKSLKRNFFLSDLTTVNRNNFAISLEASLCKPNNNEWRPEQNTSSCSSHFGNVSACSNQKTIFFNMNALKLTKVTNSLYDEVWIRDFLH